MMASMSTQNGYETEKFVEEKERAKYPVTSWIQHQPKTPIKTTQTHYDKVKKFGSSLTESIGEEEKEKASQMAIEVSREIHELNINSFLSSSGSEPPSDEEELLETVLTDLYNDPLDVCMEGIEDLATGILRSGKLLVNGEPGDMTKIQPAIFNLQATEDSISQLLPQLLQDPFFFYQLGQEPDSSISNSEDEDLLNFLTEGALDEALVNGHIRLALPVDTAIYDLIKSHCSKGARQAEEIINTSLNGNYVMLHNFAAFQVMPPIIKFCSSKVNQSSCSSRRRSSVSPEISNCGQRLDSICDITAGNVSATPFQSTSLTATDETPAAVYEKISNASTLTNVSNLTNSGSFSCMADCAMPSETPNSPMYTSGMKVRHSISSMVHEEIEPTIDEEREFSAPSDPSPPNIGNYQQQQQQYYQTTLTKQLSNGKGRKMSIFHAPTSRDSTGSDTSISDTPRYIPPGDQWNTSIIDNNTIIAQYGDMPYPMVWWEPKFKIDFHLNTSAGPLSDKVAGIDLLKPEVTLRVFNNSPRQVAFSIRSHRLSTVFKSHVVYPNRGLEVIGPYKSWEDNVEFYPNNPYVMEMFVVDLFFCTMDATPVWNVSRKYAIMKAQKKTGKFRKRMSKRKLSHIHMVGDHEQKEENLKLVISHGLQCVVKEKLTEAEIIFSHALYLPDFQRLPLKAFIYICLAVIANKWKKKGDSITLKPVMLAAEAASRLVEVCEQGGSMKMPRTIQLVKQLKKELNLPKIVKDQQKRKRIESSKSTLKRGPTLLEETVSPKGGVLCFKETAVVFPPRAVRTDIQITLSSSDTKHLTAMLKASGWGKIVQVVTALHIDTSVLVSHFDEPIYITTPIPDGVKVRESSLLRLMHSTYLNHWEDITNNKLSKVSLDAESYKLDIETNLPGWLAVSVIELDVSMITQMVLKCISSKPMIVQFSVYGFLAVDSQNMQVAASFVPCNSNEEPLYKDFNKPENFVPMSFPQLIQAYPNEKLRLEIQGNSFEPDTSLGEDNLVFNVDVQQRHNEVHTKWIRLTSPANQPISGKMKITCCRGNSENWEVIAHVNLSTQTTGMPFSSSEQP